MRNTDRGGGGGGGRGCEGSNMDRMAGNALRTKKDADLAEDGGGGTG